MAVPVIVIRILCGTGRGGGVEVDEHPRATTNDQRATSNDQRPTSNKATLGTGNDNDNSQRVRAAQPEGLFEWPQGAAMLT